MGTEKHRGVPQISRTDSDYLSNPNAALRPAACANRTPRDHGLHGRLRLTTSASVDGCYCAARRAHHRGVLQDEIRPTTHNSSVPPRRIGKEVRAQVGRSQARLGELARLKRNFPEPIATFTVNELEVI